MEFQKPEKKEPQEKRKTDKVLNVVQTHVGTLVELEGGEVRIIRTLEDLERLGHFLSN